MEGTFIWEHSRQQLTDSYSNWRPDEPNNSNEEDIVHSDFATGTWNDFTHEGAEPGAYMCERGELPYSKLDFFKTLD